jgi:hypothetical protein
MAAFGEILFREICAWERRDFLSFSQITNLVIEVFLFESLQ